MIEDTTYRPQPLKELVSQIPLPVLSVARSRLKEIEARFVGRDAVVAVDLLLRNLGVAVSGRNALMVGYGMIGKNVARSLRSYDLNVSVYDKLDHRNLQAFIDGFQIHKKREFLKSADIISATGAKAISFEEIEECKPNVILISVGSRDTEFFDVAAVKRNAVGQNKLCDGVVKYHLPAIRKA